MTEAFTGSLAGISGILGVLTLAGAALIFFILPRISTSGYLRNLGVQSSLVSRLQPGSQIWAASDRSSNPATW